MVFHTTSEEETIALGRRIAAMLPDQALVLLTGNLGAGKTTLTKGIVEGLDAGPGDAVNSPTYTLIHEYSGRTKVYHVDLYRLDEEHEVLTLGLEDLMDERAIVLVEWGERFPRLLPPAGAWRITLESDGDQGRTITVEAP